MEFKRECIKTIKEKYAPQIFIETGTLMGDTVEYFKNSFREIYSIELSEELTKKARLRFKADKNVTIINGDSSKVLKPLLAGINEPAMFWLDGHYSSEFYVGDEFIKTAKGEKDTPIEEELKTVLNAGDQHIILIDDARLFNGTNDYPSLNRLKQSIKKYNPNYGVSVKHDIIYVLPEKMKI